MMSSLLLRLPMAQHESLLSWLVRLAKHNRYDSHRTLLAWCAEQLGLTVGDMPDSVLLMPSAELITVLATLTDVAALNIWAASIHHFAPVLAPAGLLKCSPKSGVIEPVTPMLDPRATRAHLCLGAAARYCSRCLREHAHHRISWLPKAVFVCLEHRCWLHDTCPECHSPTTALNIARNHCSQCGSRLSVAKSEPLATTSLVWQTQQVLQSWLNPDLPKPNQNILTKITNLPTQPPSVLYALAAGLRSSTLLKKAASAEGRSLERTQALEWAGAIDTLCNWPHRFVALLHRQCRESQPHCGLGYLYAKWLNKDWLDPAFAFVQKAFDLFLVQACTTQPERTQKLSHLRPELCEQLNIIDQTKASQMMGISRSDIQTLICAGRLRCYQADARLHLSPSSLLYRHDVHFLLGHLPDLPTPAECARYLGCSEAWVMQMLDLGMLKSLDRLTLLRLATLLRQQSIEHRDNLRLPDAVDMLNTIGLDSLDLLRRIQTEQLPFSLGHCGQVLCVDHSCVSRTDIKAWIESVQEQHGWMPAYHACRVLDLPVDIVADLVKAGVLSVAAKFDGHLYFDRHTIERMRGQLLRGASFMQWLGIKVNPLKNWIQAGWLVPVIPYETTPVDQLLFWRADLERLSYHITLTKNHLAKYGLGAHRINDWIMTANVNLIADPDTPHDWHHLTAPQRMRPDYAM